MKEVAAKKSKLWLWLTLGAVALLAVAAVVLLPMLGQGEVQQQILLPAFPNARLEVTVFTAFALPVTARSGNLPPSTRSW